MKRILVNAFSIQMLSEPAIVRFDEIAPEDIPSDVVSAVGHADTAAVLTNILGFEVPMNRVSVSLDEFTELFVAQLVGGRLPEGATTLPEGFSFKFFRVTINNTGYYNNGSYNTGNGNVGNYNSGCLNTGDRNSGDYNYGERNTGSYNMNSRNTGSYNIGNCNTGYHNFGSHNTGDSNSGSYNSGNYNVGNYNVGDFNVGNYNTGSFNTENSKLRFFDKESNITMEEWRKSEAFAILRKIDLSPVEWVWEIEHPDHKTTGGGHLKKTDVGRFNTHKPFLTWWNGLSEEEKNIVKNIPNFDADKFYKITGIRV